TKDLLASITRRKFSTVAPERSYNNDIGVPLTLLAAGASTEVVVCELGARGPGQIARLCAYVRPQVGVVTNVGVTHYEQFGSVEAIASAKAELVAALPEGGTAVLNADDPMTSAMAAKTSANVISFGTSPTAWLRAERIRLDRLGRPSFRMVRGFEGTEASLSVAGRHQVANALAASAAAMALGLSLEECRAGLEGAVVSPWRMEVREVGGVVVVNDAYNANPTSMSSALETCAQMAGENGRLVAVLGYMAELGERSTLEHEAAGALAASLADRLVVVGEAAGPIAEGARRAGLRNVVPVPDRDAALGAIGELARGDVVLVKASRIAGLDALAGALLEVLEPLEKFERPAAR
ncbi:MAG: UDP-N-acetylmuramoyl-tripeptide--D-alanyl-D-alanine ligase, partial [Acidimicrobiales bacterium]